MEFVAVSKSVKISPRKVRLVADVVRNRSAKDALAQLSLMARIAGNAIEKTIKSAIANAEFSLKKSNDTEKFAIETLRIKSIEISEGPVLKRFHPSTRGRIHPYKKRSSHIKIVLTNDQTKKKGKKYGTKS